MTSSRALRRWLVFVAALRLLSGLKLHFSSALLMSDAIAVYIGIFHPEKFRSNLFDLQPTEGVEFDVVLRSGVDVSCSDGALWTDVCNVDVSNVHAVCHLLTQSRKPGRLWFDWICLLEIVEGGIQVLR